MNYHQSVFSTPMEEIEILREEVQTLCKENYLLKKEKKEMEELIQKLYKQIQDQYREGGRILHPKKEFAWLNNLETWEEGEVEGEEMSSFSTKDFKTIVRKTETESINSLISFDDESYLEEKMCEIRLHFMVIRECTNLLENMFSKGVK